MNWWRWLEFFQDDKGKLSPTSLSFMTCVGSMLFAFIYTIVTTGVNIELCWAWIGLCTMGLVTKKGFDAINRGSNNDASS